MAHFTVRRTVDAFAVYTTEIEANTPEEAAKLAHDNEDNYNWGTPDIPTFDARDFTTLDNEGAGIEETTIGNL